MDGMPFTYNAIADKHPDVRDLVERIYKQGERKSTRIAELEAALDRLRVLGLEFEDTQTVTIALEPWREAMGVLKAG